MADIAETLRISVRTLRKKFDALPESILLKPAPLQPINLIIDATFFGREYGFLCFSDGKKIVYAREIKNETVAELGAGLTVLQAAGYRFKSFTLDGKRGFIQCLKRTFPHTPVQMCHFHMQAIIRRYNTQNPKSECGKDLKNLMRTLGQCAPQNWIDAFFAWKKKHHEFLNSKNDLGQYSHRKLRSAARSITTFLPYLFLYQELPTLSIPNTTNALEGRFAHIKEKITIHRGLNINRKKKAIKFLLSNA